MALQTPVQDTTLGFPVSVLLGHSAAVTWVDFHPKLPSALVSCSYDGTVSMSSLAKCWCARLPVTGGWCVEFGSLLSCYQTNPSFPIVSLRCLC